MNEINVNTKTNLECFIGASEEFSLAMRKLGISVTVHPQRGAHGAEFYVYSEHVEKFENEILDKVIVGTYHKFFITKHSNCTYYVSYMLIKK